MSLQTICKSNRKICKYYKKNLLSLFQQMTSVDFTVFFLLVCEPRAKTGIFVLYKVENSTFYAARKSPLSLSVHNILLFSNLKNLKSFCGKKTLLTALGFEPRSFDCRLLVWLLPSPLIRHQTSHLQNKFFFPSCTIYYL